MKAKCNGIATFDKRNERIYSLTELVPHSGAEAVAGAVVFEIFD